MASEGAGRLRGSAASWGNQEIGGDQGFRVCPLPLPTTGPGGPVPTTPLVLGRMLDPSHLCPWPQAVQKPTWVLAGYCCAQPGMASAVPRGTKGGHLGKIHKQMHTPLEELLRRPQAGVHPSAARTASGSQQAVQETLVLPPGHRDLPWAAAGRQERCRGAAQRPRPGRRQCPGSLRTEPSAAGS